MSWKCLHPNLNNKESRSKTRRFIDHCSNNSWHGNESLDPLIFVFKINNLLPYIDQRFIYQPLLVWVNSPLFATSYIPGSCLLVGPCSAKKMIFCEWLHQSWLLPDGLSLFGQSICSNALHHGGQLSLIRIVPLIKSQGPRPPPFASFPFAILVQWVSIPNVVMANCPNFWMTWKDTRRRLLRLHMHNAMITALKSNENIKCSLASIVPVLVGSLHWAKCQFADCPICEKLETDRGR